MTAIKQTLALVKQELRSASRTRYILMSFIMMPILIWGMQGGMQAFMVFSMDSTQEGSTIYIVNYDEGNSNGVNLGDLYIEALVYETQSNNSLLSGAKIDSSTFGSETYSEIIERINDPKKISTATPIVILPQNFTNEYLAFNGTNDSIAPKIELYLSPGGLMESSYLTIAVTNTATNLFTVVTVDKIVTVSSETITFPGEESISVGLGAGFVGFLSVLIAVMAPAPFVSSSFAGEREKKTMESLLALPIPRFNILLGKLIAGMVLVGIFALANILGLIGYTMFMENVFTGEGSEIAAALSIDLSLETIILVGVTMFLSALVSIGIGISIASLTKDVRSSESMYTMIMMIPALAVGMAGMFGSLPEQSFGGAGILLYLIPWTHATSIFSKGLYPQTYASSTITGSIIFDIFIHLGYMIIVILACLFIASKVFDREGIIK